MAGSPGRRVGTGISAHRSLPPTDELCALSPLQKEILHAQQRMPELPLTVSHYVDVSGKLDLDLMRASIGRAGLEYGFGNVSVQVVQGVAMNHIGRDVRDHVETIDLRSEADPQSAAHNWMVRESTHRIDPLTDRLARCAVLLLADSQLYLYARVHQIVLDNTGLRSMTIRAAEIYTALIQKRRVPVRSAQSVRTVVTTELDYRGSTRWNNDQLYWDAALVGAPPRTSLAREVAPPAAVTRVRAGTVHLDVTAALERVARSQGVTLSIVVIASFALYLARMTSCSDVVVRIPAPVRTTAAMRRSGGTTSNVLPLRVMIDWLGGIDQLLRDVKSELVGALRHQKYRDARSPEGPIFNPTLFPHRITLGEADGAFHTVSSGPVEDLDVTLSQASPTSEVNIEFAANPDMYSELALTTHHGQFLEFLEWFSKADAHTPLMRDTPRFGADRAQLPGSDGDSAVRHSENLAYWSEQLSAPVPRLQLLPTAAGEHSSAAFIVDADLHQALKALADSMYTSMFVLYQAAVAGLLRRTSSPAEVSIGTSIRGYGASNPDEFVSMFAHHIVLRTHIDTSLSLARLIEQMDEVVVDALIHADIRLSSVMAAVDERRSVDAGPRFRALVCAQEPIDTHPRFPAVMAGLPVGYDLTTMPELYVSLPILPGHPFDPDQPIVGFLDCAAPQEQCEDLAVKLACILRAMVDDSHRALGDVDLVP